MTFLESKEIFSIIGILSIPMAPLALALLFCSSKCKTGAILLTPWVALLPLLTIAFTPTETYIDLPWLWIGGALGLGTSAKPFLVFTSLVWFLGGIFAQKYLDHDDKRPVFFLCYLLALSGNLGLIVAQDFLSFKTFFSLMSFASYGLIVHNADPEALKSGRVYMVMTLLGEVILFAAILLVYHLSGNLNFRADSIVNLPIGIQFLLLFGFGIKAGIFPLHIWLPLAHTHAPAPASAILSGVMIKAGLLGWLRFFPIEANVYPEIGIFSIALGFFTAFYGVIVGITQDNPKTVLAYSSISQIGLMLSALGICWLSHDMQTKNLTVILFYAFHHAFAKSALFLGVCLAMGSRSCSPERLKIIIGLTIPALSLAGFMFTGGALAKAGIKLQVRFLSEPQQEIIVLLLSLSSVGTAILMVRFLQILWKQEWPHVLTRINSLQIIWLSALVFVMLAPWFYPLPAMIVNPILSMNGIWNSIWPVGLGILIFVLGWRLWGGDMISFSRKFPPGDIIRLVDYLANSLKKIFEQLAKVKDRMTQSIYTSSSFDKNSLKTNKEVFIILEEFLSSWPVFGSLYALIIIGLILTLNWL